MNDKSQSKLPIWLIVLDAIGALLVAAGIFLLVGAADLWSVDPERLRGPGIAIIVIGVMLMVPLVKVVVQRVISSR